ncbi:MAG: hypothetical protein ABH811_01440 [archaeon]
METYRSMLEIEKKFYPKTFQKRLVKRKSIVQKVFEEFKPEYDKALEGYNLAIKKRKCFQI